MMTNEDFRFLCRSIKHTQQELAAAIGVTNGALAQTLRRYPEGLPVRYERPIRTYAATLGYQVPNTLPDGSTTPPELVEPHYTRRNPPPGHYWSAKFKAFVELEHMPYANRVKNRLAQRRRGDPVTF